MSKKKGGKIQLRHALGAEYIGWGLISQSGELIGLHDTVTYTTSYDLYIQLIQCTWNANFNWFETGTKRAVSKAQAEQGAWYGPPN